MSAMSVAGRSSWARVLPVTVALLTATSCHFWEPEKTEITRDDLVGTWVGDAGGRVTFGADHTFRFESVGLDSYTYPSCPDGDSSGSWVFYVEHDGGAFGDETAASGAMLALQFQGQEMGACMLDINVIDAGGTLCVSDDPDFVCTMDERYALERKS
ncbi:hypothetical protein [Streptomyces sp. NPDC048659]|uniref:hypothetical protein n=1 Tax=Streptomyces sp. NPDC048659 TaxID=3155489 RepID=UPI0034464499